MGYGKESVCQEDITIPGLGSAKMGGKQARRRSKIR